MLNLGLCRVQVWLIACCKSVSRHLPVSIRETRGLRVCPTSEPATHQALRHLKVGYVSHRHADRNDMTRYYSRSPSLHLQGNWLAAAGFATDTPVVITVEQGQLLIRIVAE
ncbi:SymE family type I addiction module toxin [Pectobacterium brasiliense]|uniref:SymE family type I addiction module toxin n=1 Tax=Pectobacterium brasiliense TaxID=180957 RepID=UPI003AFA80D5